MPALLAAAFLAGLLGSLHCVGMCGAFAASCTRSAAGLPAWHVGRIGTYALLGALAGSMGDILPGPAWLPAALAAFLLTWFALGLAGLVPEPRLVPPGLVAAGSRAAVSTSPAAQFLFGVVNGFLPCGLVYSALGIPVALAGALPGALAMIAFGAGTVPALSFAAFGLRRLALASLGRRRAFAALVFIVGMWAILMRAKPITTAGDHHPAGSTPAQSGSQRPF